MHKQSQKRCGVQYPLNKVQQKSNCQFDKAYVMQSSKLSCKSTITTFSLLYTAALWILKLYLARDPMKKMVISSGRSSWRFCKTTEIKRVSFLFSFFLFENWHWWFLTHFAWSYHIYGLDYNSAITCAHKWIKHYHIVSNFGHIGHNECKSGIHAGIAYKMSLLDGIFICQVPLTIHYLYRETKKEREREREREKERERKGILWLEWNLITSIGHDCLKRLFIDFFDKNCHILLHKKLKIQWK